MMSMALVPPAVLAPALAPVAVIPIRLVNGHVLVDATVNGRHATLILDTGSSVSALDSTWASGSEIERAAQSVTVAGASTSTVRLGTVRDLRVGSIAVSGIPAVIVSLDAVSRAGGVPVHGTLGYDFIVRYVIEIDYAGRELRLFEPKTYDSTDSTAAEVPVSLQYRIPTIDANVVTATGARVRPRFVLDLGSSRIAIRLSASFVEKHRAAFGSLEGLRTSIGTGVGGQLPGIVAHVESVDLGALRVARPTAGFATEKKGALEVGYFDGSIGAPVFERTTMVLDYSRSRILFHRKPGFDAPYVYTPLTTTP